MCRPLKLVKDNIYRFKDSRGIFQKFDNFLVLDFEATCDRNKRITPQEIIEFPCLKVSSLTFQVVDEFHQYVQPKFHRELTPFCTELTGILQEMVDDAPLFTEVFDQFNNWLEKTKSFNHEEKNIFVTCGDWDLSSMLPRQCETSQIPVPTYIDPWINIKVSFAKATGYFPRGLVDMLTKLKLPMKGRLHSGIDDCYNIVSIMKSMAENNFVFEATSDLIPKGDKFLSPTYLNKIMSKTKQQEEHLHQ